MKIIDLSQTIHSDMPVYPGDPEVNVSLVHTYKTHSWTLRKLELSTHTGTHVDAFSHMHESLASLDEIPLERFFGEARVVSDKIPLKQGIGLFFVEEISLEMLDTLLQAKPNFVGGHLTEALERALLTNEIITYTNLINLEQLPFNCSFTFYGLPLKIQEGDGSPVRAIAILED